jgi:hypothetical protein
MEKISRSSRVVVADDVVSCDLDGEAAILDVKEGIYYGLNPVGARIWNLVQEPTTVDEILKVLLEEYDVELEECRRDVYELIEELSDNGLVNVDKN